MHRKDRVTKPNESCVGEQLIEWPCPVVVGYCEIFLVRCCYLYICVLACKYRTSSSVRQDLGPNETAKRSYPKKLWDESRQSSCDPPEVHGSRLLMSLPAASDEIGVLGVFRVDLYYVQARRSSRGSGEVHWSWGERRLPKPREDHVLAQGRVAMEAGMLGMVTTNLAWE